MMGSKAGLSFSFAKKAEPKRVVESLAQKKEDGRVAITALEGGQVTVDGKAEAASKLTIRCKNPLEGRAPAAPAPEATAAVRAKALEALENQEGGLLKRPAPEISAEDAEALRELKRAGGGIDSGPAVAVAPILMRDGSKRTREGDAPDATKDMFEKIPVESFGEAMLRGMGFDPSKHQTKPVFHDKLRDTHLGLGAKALLPSEKLPPARAKARGAPAPTAASASPTAAAASPAAAAASPTAAAASPTAAASPAVEAPVGGAPAPAHAPVAPAADCWPSRGLLVRLRGRDREFREFRGSDAVVLEADAASMSCRVKARLGEKSHVLQGVPVSDLEPIVGPECAEVRVLRGPHKGVDAKLLRRSSRQSVVWVQAGGAECQLPAGDVCEFVGRKR